MVHPGWYDFRLSFLKISLLQLFCCVFELNVLNKTGWKRLHCFIGEQMNMILQSNLENFDLLFGDGSGPVK